MNDLLQTREKPSLSLASNPNPEVDPDQARMRQSHQQHHLNPHHYNRPHSLKLKMHQLHLAGQHH
jgi:hypothetical protein